jgi:apolipoprotein N-acyltransferase
VAHGLAAGFVYFLGTVYWVTGVMAAHGGLPDAVAAAIAALLAAYLALYVGLFAGLLQAAVRAFGVAGVWFAPACWVAGEWLRSTLGGGFPWVLLGTSQAPVLPIAQAASVVGVYGVSGIVALVGTGAAVMALTRRRAHVAGAAAVAAVLVLIGVAGLVRLSRADLTAAGAPLRAGIVQGNIPQEQKWDPLYRAPILERYLSLSRTALGDGAELVVWPEASTPFYLDAEAELARPIRRLAAEAGTPFLIGTDEFVRGWNGDPDRIYNAAVLIDATGRSHGTYRKMQLVPFGEYVPLQTLLFFVGPLVEAVSDFTAGTEPVVFDAGGRQMSVAICYESVYPWIAQAFVERGSELLVTITNDAWFGRSSAAFQHFDQGAMRAIEQGRYVVRAANTGISGAVDPYGRPLVRTPLFETAAITVDVRLLDGRTIYSRIGDVPVWVSFVMAAWALVSNRRRGTFEAQSSGPGREP